MRRVTRLFRIAAFAVAATALPGALFAQTPTPTATPTPTPTPTPLVPATQLPASAGSLGIPNGGRYDQRYASALMPEEHGPVQPGFREKLRVQQVPDGIAEHVHAVDYDGQREMDACHVWRLDPATVNMLAVYVQSLGRTN